MYICLLPVMKVCVRCYCPVEFECFRHHLDLGPCSACYHAIQPALHDIEHQYIALDPGNRSYTAAGHQQYRIVSLLCLQNLPITNMCDSDVTQLCLKTQGWDSLRIGQAKQCLVNLGVPLDPALLLAAQVCPR